MVSGAFVHWTINESDFTSLQLTHLSISSQDDDILLKSYLM